MLKAHNALYFRLWDALLVLISLQLSYHVRLAIELGAPSNAEFIVVPWLLFPIALIVWQIVFQVFNVYAVAPKWLRTSVLRRLLQAHALATLTFWGVLYVSYRDFSRLQSVYFVIVLIVVMVVARLLFNAIQPLFGARRRNKRNVLIVGINRYAAEIGRVIRDTSSEGLHLVGFVPHKDEAVAPDAAQVLGAFESLPDLVREYAIDEVIVCDESHSRRYLHDITDMLLPLPMNVRLAPDYSELAYFHVSVEDFGGIPMISLRYDLLTSGQRFTKRVFDIIGATVLLTLALPLLIVLAIAIRLDTPGPVFFRQLRVGERGKLFTMYKLRTMVWDAESKITYTKHYKQADDPRVTRTGRVMRRASLDEIPQFFNVLIGDMTLVGPRPELPQVVQLYSPWQRKRFEVPQGVTGWWQINGRADLPMYEHVEYDVFYIRNYSIWLDLQILARTPLALLRGRGAY
ncbi:MAG: sugar transferase [Chloroflexota bacterium]|nr:sugar transferase [Chloroflexota bacterium]